MSKKINLKSKVSKINYDEILNHDVIREEKGALLGGSTAFPSGTIKHVLGRCKDINKELYTTLDSKINELLPENILQCVTETMKAKGIVDRIEDEIQQLKLKAANYSDGTTESKIEAMSIQLDIDLKNEELTDARKVFMEAYKTALANTVISEELYELYEQARVITTELLNEMDEKIEMYRAKAKALIVSRRDMRVFDDVQRLINQRINHGNIAELAIESSKKNIPLIKSIIK
ncbi:hypothetical protein [Ruminiclostridium cellulolyticum]|uniref:Uncharacterized protein n=1 Tax=Ruminiclostridium cellulolyticum (strain ATCC 35319 / DSM 5812 / JCM 6584 / H10) TaxID=394503 RepID=B8I345_RUMCH|nr:hypothetical protein [Ruminiclostridium cellulolyticum]ACL76188.1 hypothetical protein Ccel_1840 [Ruminiclostridium cellulolyticum H10]